MLLLIGAAIAIQTPYVQTKITQRVLDGLNEQFGTAISVGEVDVDFFGDVNLYDVEAKDHKNLNFIQIPKLRANLSLWDIYQNSNDIRLDAVDLKNANVQVITYKGEEESNFIQFIDKFVTEDDGSESEFKLRGNLKIENSQFSIINQNLPENEQVWLDSDNFNATIKNVDIKGSTYLADIKKLNFEAEKNGEKYALKQLGTQFKMNDNGLFFNDLELKTQSSSLNGHVHLKYDSIAQFSDFNNKIQWDLDLSEKDSVAYKDIRYFVPDWEKDETIAISGKTTGTLNNLNLQNLKLKNGDTQIATNQIQLMDVMKGSYVVRSDFLEAKTSYQDLKRILPNDVTLPDDVKKFGTIHYKGSLQLNEQDLVAKGRTKTALGNAVLDLKIYDYAGNLPKYQGKVQTDGFDLKTLTETQELGKVNGNITFDGEGFDIETLRINANGKLNYLDLNDERYQNISVNGILNQQKFAGFLAINDPNARLSYDGIFDFSEKQLKASFNSKVDYLNLTKLGILKEENSWLKADIHSDAEFTSISDLEGFVQMKNIHFHSDTIDLKLPDANLNIKTINDMQRDLNLDVPGYLAANINGKFEIDELADVLQNGFGNFLVDFERKKVSPNQKFTFDINVQDNIVNYFVPGLYLQPETTVKGQANEATELFEFQLASPFIQYETYKADSVRLFASTVENKTFKLNAKRIDIQNYKVNDFVINGHSRQDTIVANAHFYTGEDYHGEFDLNFYQTFNEKRELKTGFAPSTIKLDNQLWQVNPENSQENNYAILDFDNNKFIAKEILFQSDEQYIRINGEYFNQNDFDMDAELVNVNLTKVIPKSILEDFDIAGIANGKINVEKNENELKPVADLQIDSIALNGFLIGNFVTEASYDVDEQVFNIQGSLDRDNVNTLYLTGAIDNKGETPQLDMVANLDDFHIDILGVFLEDVLNEWEGNLSGDLSIKGNPVDPELNGFITGEDIGFGVVYLGTKYQMQGENDFILSKVPGTYGSLILPDVGFTETSSKTQGSVDGSLIFTDLSNWFLDLEFNTDKLLVMNTTVADNELFFGKVYSGGTFELFGPASDLEIAGYDVNVLKGSNISLNTGATASVESNRFIQFYSYDAEGNLVEDEENETEISGFSIDLALNVDEGTTVNLVLDEQNDDKILAQGNAQDFKIEMNKAGNLNIEGEYNITSGIYNYKEALVIDKDFEIEDGGYIRFDGDPYNATMDIRAAYSRYVNNVGEYLGLNTTQATVIDLVIAITGNLENTNIDFLIEAPDAGNQVKSALNNKLASNIDERTIQAGFLLGLGRFSTENQLDAETATGAATASAFELLGKQIGNIFSSIIPGFEFNPTYLQSTDKSYKADRIQAQYNLALNERLKINGAVGTPLGSQTNEEVTMQVELEYDISEKADGGLVLRGFSRPTTLGIENFNINSSFAQSYGAGVVYKRSFNSFKELFKGKKNRGKKPLPQDSIQAIEPKKDSLSTQKDLSFIHFGK